MNCNWYLGSQLGDVLVGQYAYQRGADLIGLGLEAGGERRKDDALEHVVVFVHCVLLFLR
jgi:hypothetical protein